MYPLPALGFPTRRYAATLVFQAAMLWLGLHLLLAIALAAAGADPLGTGPASLLLVGLCPVLVRLDGRRQREHLFQGNLGTAPGWLTAIPLATAAALELSLAALAG